MFVSGARYNVLATMIFNPARAARELISEHEAARSTMHQGWLLFWLFWRGQAWCESFVVKAILP